MLFKSLKKSSSDKVYDKSCKSVSKMCIFTLLLKSLREPDFFTVSGRSFHNRGAEEENDPLYIVFFDLSTAREPFVIDLSVRRCNCDTGVRRSEI